MEAKEIITYFLAKKILVSRPIIEKMIARDIHPESLAEFLAEKGLAASFALQESHLADFLNQHMPGQEAFRAISSSSAPSSVKILFDYTSPSHSWDVQDFVGHFSQRFASIEKILQNRAELQNLLSISRIKQKKDKDQVSLIGMITESSTTKNGNLMITVEDRSGSINVLVNKTKPELFAAAQDLVLDEVVGIAGASGDKIVFANSIVWPDIPENRTFKKCEDDVCMAVLSDFHAGSSYFMPDHLKKFIDWINGTVGSDEQKALAQKVKYLFLVGDLVAGVGIYPGQEHELRVPDIYNQYEEMATYIRQIPRDIHVIICPGNHDAVRLAEPQPKMDNDFTKVLTDIPNVILVSNPSLINIHASENFPGFDVLLYHGYSFDYYIANVDSLRLQGGYDRVDLIMKFLLKRRHLAPSHGSTLYIPDPKIDPLVISTIPDFFLTGHLHKSSVSHYKHITLVCGSCWESTTPFEEKVGHHPEPGRVPVISLKTRNAKIMRF